MDFKMRRSRVLSRLREGKVANCFKVNFSDPRAVELVARYGFDCVWTCMEHVGNNWSTIESQVWAAKGYDVDILCRVSRGGYSDYVRPLEMDASGIMVPHVMSPEDASRVVQMTKFPPVGRRAVDGGNADGGYCTVPFLDYLKDANRERFVILQIEDPETEDKLDEIASVPGYDILFFGPGDYSVAIGEPGNLAHPRVAGMRKRVAEAAAKYGKFAGTVGNPANRQELIDLGYRFISMGADVVAVSLYCGQMAEACGITKENNPVTMYGVKQ